MSPLGVGAHYCEEAIGVLRGYDRYQPALAGTVEGSEPEQLAGAADFGPQRDCLLVQSHGKRGGGGKFAEGGGEAATGWIAHAANGRTGLQHHLGEAA